MNERLSSAWSWLRGLKLIDCAFLALTLFVMAFYDLRMPNLVVQGVFLLLVAQELLAQKKHLFGSQTRNIYILWYLMFFLWAALSYLWAENHSTYLSMMISLAQVAVIGVGVSYYINSWKRVHFALFALAFTGLVFCVRFLLSAPLDMLGDEHVRRIGRLISFGGNRGAVMLSFVSLVLVYLAISQKKYWLYLPVVIFMFISLLFGSRVVLIFLFPGVFFLLLAHARTIRKFLLSLVALVVAAALTFVLITQLPLLDRIIGRRFDNLGEVLSASRVLSNQEMATDLQDKQAVQPTSPAAPAELTGKLEQEVAQPEASSAFEESIGKQDQVVATVADLDPQLAEDVLQAQIVRAQASSANTRMDLVLKALESFQRQPLIGIGLDNFRFVSAPHYTYAHSTQLELLATLGLVGFGLYFWMYAYLLINAWRQRRTNPYSTLIFGFVAALFLADFFLMTYDSERDHLYLGLFAGILCQGEGEPSLGVATLPSSYVAAETEVRA